MTVEQEKELFLEKIFEQLEVGDSIFGTILHGWRFVAPIPNDVAEAWLAEHFPNSIISKKGVTPSTGPMKEWEVGIGIVVAAPAAMFNKEKLNLLHKAGKGDVRLYLSEDMRKKRSQTEVT